MKKFLLTIVVLFCSVSQVHAQYVKHKVGDIAYRAGGYYKLNKQYGWEWYPTPIPTPRVAVYATSPSYFLKSYSGNIFFGHSIERMTYDVSYIYGGKSYTDTGCSNLTYLGQCLHYQLADGNKATLSPLTEWRVLTVPIKEEDEEEKIGGDK